MLMVEELALSWGEEQVEQDGQVDTRLHDRTDIQAALELLHRPFLRQHGPVALAETLGKEDVFEPRRQSIRHSLRFLEHRLCVLLTQMKRWSLSLLAFPASARAEPGCRAG